MKEEHGRLAELKRLIDLESGPDRAYDDITSMAAAIFGTPIALISVVDDKRQWFLSRVGLAAQQTPREDAFCAVAIRTPDAPLIVPDATQDARFVDNPLVTGEPNIRFYAGAPLVTSNGHALGTVCVIDTVPRTIDASQLEELRALAQAVIARLERNLGPQVTRSTDDDQSLFEELPAT